MFKKLQKSVIDKNKLLLTNLSKKRVNITPSKLVFPNRANLTFANIIVNMSSTPSLNTIDNWSNSYFSTELYNNSFISKSKTNLNKLITNTNETIRSHSKLLSIIINGILSLKSNDLLTYSMKLMETIIYIRDNIDNNDYIEINNEKNKDLLMIIYQTYFQIFNDNNLIVILLKKDLNNDMRIFKKAHSIYIFFILSGIIYIHYNIKRDYKSFYNFLKNLIKNEKCKDINCPLCSQIDKIEQKLSYVNYKGNQINLVQKPSVIKIVGRYKKNNNNLNKLFNNKQKFKNNIINNSNDNIIPKIICQSHNKDKIINKKEGKNHSNIISKRSKKKILDIKKYQINVSENRKQTFHSQIIKANEKEKKQFFNDSFSIKEKSNSKNKNQILNTERNILYNSNDNFEMKEKMFFTEINDNRNEKIIKAKEFSNLIGEIKINLYKNNKLNRNCENRNDNKIKYLDTIENNNNSNKKLIEINRNNKNQLNNKIIKINSSNETRINKELKNNIINNEKLFNIIPDNKVYNEINSNLNNSSRIIIENINAIEKELKDFKDHNNCIKQQLNFLTKNYKW
jgi:hypothetical protein